MPRIILTAPAVLLLAALPVFSDGVPPRTASADYPAHQSTKDFELGAGLLSAEQVKKILPEKIRQKYVVVEVALYPKSAGVDVRAFVVDSRRKKELQKQVREHVEAGSAIFSDELKSL